MSFMDERDPPPEWDGKSPPDGEGTPLAKPWPAAVDFEYLADREPEPPKFLVADWLPAGYATLMAGHGGVGKSGIALHLAVCMCLGRPFFGIPVVKRRIMYLSCEDRQSVLHWRLSRICAYEQIKITDLIGHMELLDLVGQDTVLWRPPMRDGKLFTDAYGSLAYRFAQGQCEVLFVDGISDTFGGNENDKIDVKQYVNALIRLIDPDKGAVTLIGHVNKMTASSDGGASEGYSGTAGWHNSVRARWYLYPETAKDDGKTVKTGTLSLDLQKSNLGLSEHALKFSWDEQAHMFLGEIIPPESNMEKAMRERDERAAILACIAAIVATGNRVPTAATGQRTTWHVLSAHHLFPDSLKGQNGSRKLNRMIEGMRHMGEIIVKTERINYKNLDSFHPGN